jgi:hypothetical protein
MKYTTYSCQYVPQPPLIKGCEFIAVDYLDLISAFIAYKFFKLHN